MDYIGKRISIKRSEKETSIVILSTVDKAKKRLLFTWFALWTICGLIVAVYYFFLKDQQTRVAVIVWLGFWAYFEYKTLMAVRWRSSGMEKIKLKERKMFYKRDVGGKGKVKVYEFDFMKDFKVLESKDNSFFENLNNSYWVIAGEKLSFDYYGKETKIGLQLDDADAKALFKLINGKI